VFRKSGRYATRTLFVPFELAVTGMLIVRDHENAGLLCRKSSFGEGKVFKVTDCQWFARHNPGGKREKLDVPETIR